MSEVKKDPFFVPDGEGWPYADEWVRLGQKVYRTYDLDEHGRPLTRIGALVSIGSEPESTGVEAGCAGQTYLSPLADQVSGPQSS